MLDLALTEDPSRNLSFSSRKSKFKHVLKQKPGDSSDQVENLNKLDVKASLLRSDRNPRLLKLIYTSHYDSFGRYPK
jgi:hypothetical protein